MAAAAAVASMSKCGPLAAGLPSLTCGAPRGARAASSAQSFATPFLRGASAASNSTFLSLSNVRGDARTTCFARDWLRTDLSVIGFGLIGWLAPSSIPAIGGQSLSGLFFSSIGPELAHWPTGPALTSPFWLWMITWHIGLFITLTLGQIGFKGRKDGYF